MIRTIGHSTHQIEEFISLLHAHGVTVVVDVRRIPGSRRHPQFGREALEAALRGTGIGYIHAEALGGRRAPAADSVNLALDDPQLRGYADHMSTSAFVHALSKLLELSGAPAVMCAEADPKRCHRFLLSDALVARAVPVEHIVDGGESRAHRLSEHARVDNGSVSYPGTDALF